jgi:hypothetical protein
MTGPEHYKEAERLLANIAGDDDADSIVVREFVPELLAVAQVHATLALAAANMRRGGAVASMETRIGEASTPPPCTRSSDWRSPTCSRPRRRPS